MSQIAKCPLCRKQPYILYYTQIEHHAECCRVKMPVRLWNQYAAAMELAKKMKELSEVWGLYECTHAEVDRLMAEGKE